MTNIGNNTMNKKNLFGISTTALALSLVFALVFSVFPQTTHASFNPLDPFGLFQSDAPRVVNNTNSNNVNSNVNSPGSTVNATTVNGTTVTPGVQIIPVVYNTDYTTQYQNGGSYQGALSATCYADPVYSRVNSTVTWRVNARGGNGSYSFSWDGTDGLSGSGSTLYRSYSYPGIKNASVVINSNGTSIRVSCNNSVTIEGDGSYYGGTYYNNNNYNSGYGYDYYDPNYNRYNGSYSDTGPLSISCTPSVTFAQVGEYVTWNASVTGGTGYYTYSWAGNDDIRGSDRVVNVRYTATGPKSASITVRSNGRILTQSCGYVTIGAPIPGYAASQVTTPTYTQAAPTYVSRRPSAPAATATPTPSTSSSQGAAAFLALNNVPWGAVAIIVIFVLFGTVMYLLFNKSKI